MWRREGPKKGEQMFLYLQVVVNHPFAVITN
jgi:hypothetical protein